MITLQIFGIQTLLSLIVYAIVAWWYVAPRLAALPLRLALPFLLIPHTLRGMGLVFLVPVVTDPNLPSSFAVPAAYGDLLSALLALIALIALRYGWKGGLGLVWLFNLVGTADLLYALISGGLAKLTNYQLGAAWFIPTFIVPALLVIHVLVFIMLIQRQSEYRVVKANQLSNKETA